MNRWIMAQRAAAAGMVLAAGISVRGEGSWLDARLWDRLSLGTAAMPEAPLLPASPTLRPPSLNNLLFAKPLRCRMDWLGETVQGLLWPSGEVIVNRLGWYDVAGLARFDTSAKFIQVPRRWMNPPEESTVRYPPQWAVHGHDETGWGEILPLDYVDVLDCRIMFLAASREIWAQGTKKPTHAGER